MDACFGHVVYDSRAVADNAVTLHTLAFPACGGITAWACGPHWHIGHASAGVGQRCKTDAEHVASRSRIRRALRSLRPRT